MPRCNSENCSRIGYLQWLGELRCGLHAPHGATLNPDFRRFATVRQEEILDTLARGRNWTVVQAILGISRERIRQVLHKVNRKIEGE